MRRRAIVILLAGGAAAAAPASAHHSFAAEFSLDRPVELKGTVTKVEWVNPHSWFHLEVAGDDGEPVVWMVEGGSPNALIRRGVTAQSVPPGIEVTVEGYQARDGSRTAVGRSFLLATGERLFLGGSAENLPAASNVPARTSTASALDAAIAGAHRAEQDRARDRYRHPKETLEFFGFRPEMTVVEIWPASGWYTDILAPALRDGGKLYLAEYGDDPPFPYQRREMEALAAKIQAAPEIYGDIERTALDFDERSKLAPDRSADLVVTFRNVHNWLDPEYGPPNAPEIAFRAIYAALKPGGVLGIVDHRWPDPQTEDPRAANGYVSEERVIRLAEAAGFELAGRSDVNRNPRDTHDHPNGVWTLPPDLAAPPEERQRYIEIGESDRFTLKLVKPAD